MSKELLPPDKFSPEMVGSYRTILQALHRHLKPRSYLEIGTQTGATLKIAQCPSIAVDPHFKITSDIIGAKPSCHLFQNTSDNFFRDMSPIEIFRGSVDIAFLDGMHLYEYLLRDFMNTEKSCNPNSLIVLHDCLPLDDIMTRRSQRGNSEGSAFPGYWTGDVWKVIPILSEYRPDLRIYAVNAAPTGLVIITGLSPKNDFLGEKYQEIISKYKDVKLSHYDLERFWGELKFIPFEAFNTLEGVSEYFYI